MSSSNGGDLPLSNSFDPQTFSVLFPTDSASPFVRQLNPSFEKEFSKNCFFKLDKFETLEKVNLTCIVSPHYTTVIRL